MKILVVGGAGFIGSHVVKKIIESGNEAQVLDNFSVGKKENLPKDIVTYEADIRDVDSLEDIFSKNKFDAVCHLVASTNVRKSIIDPINDIEHNIRGLVNVLEISKKYGISKFVYSSTGGALYGEPDVFPTPEDYQKRPISPYGIDKLAGENYLYYYSRSHGMDTVALRYSNVFGPGQENKKPSSAIYTFIDCVASRKPVTISGDGKQTRDFIYIDDVATVNLLALLDDNNKGFNAYNVGSGKEVYIIDVCKMISDELGIKADINYAEKNSGEILRSCLDIGKLKKQLCFEPKYSLRGGLVEYLNYLDLINNNLK